MPNALDNATDNNRGWNSIKVGLAGFGVSGRYFHYPFITGNPCFQLSKILTSRDFGSDIATGIKRVESFDELLIDSDLELIVVATPSQCHVPQAERALLAGKHVIVEKPLALSVVELSRLEIAARQASRLLIPFQNRRWDGDFLTLQDILASPVLGSIQRIESSWPIYKGDVTPRASWKRDSSPLNSALYELGSHMVDQIVYLFGQPKKIYCQAVFDKDGTMSRNAFFMDLYYASGMTACLDVDRTRANLKPRYFVVGTKGEFEKHGLDPQENALKSGAQPSDQNYGTEAPDIWGEIRLVYPDGQRKSEKCPTIRGCYGEFYDLVASAIRCNSPPPVKLSEIATQVKILEAAILSASTSRIVSIDR